MQIGDIVAGRASAAAGYAYVVAQPLGVPGLFGQALLARRTDTEAEVVLKTLRADRPTEDRERFLHEARVLTLLAEHEQRAGKHYAVRLLDQSALDAPEIFLVLERAVGQNVLDQLVEPIADWQHAPLDEQLALEIAWQLALALRIAHQAGICYDDMKLDNLFWSAERPDDPLRIIDWNVTSTVAERGSVAGDWARFGARLYELRTGNRIGVDYAGTLLGAGPGGPLWQQLPAGTRDLITQALGMRYTDDDMLLRDLKREREQARLDWPALIERAQIADGAGQSIEVLAPIARAMRLLEALPPDAPARAEGLASCVELGQRAAQRGGLASARALESAMQSLARNEPRLAIERFQKAYNDTGARDPRARRGIWLAQLAIDQAERFRAQRANLEAAVEALSQNDPHSARQRLAQVCQADPDLAAALHLRAEAEALAAFAADQIPTAIEWLHQLASQAERYPDLKTLRAELQQHEAARQRRAAAEQRERELWQAAQADLASAEQAEQAEELAQAQRLVERALAGLQQLLIGGCSPALEPNVRGLRDVANAQLERLARQAQIRLLPDLMNSADPRQRRLALQRAEALIPEWGHLGRLRKQVRQIEAACMAVERARGAQQVAVADQGLAALDTLDRMEIRFDLAGSGLQQIRAELLTLRLALIDAQAEAQLNTAHTMLEEARLQLSRTRCAEAIQWLQSIDTRNCSPALAEALAQAQQLAAELERRLAHVAEQRMPIDQALERADTLAACRLAQQLAQSYPQLPLLAAEATEIEQVLLGRLLAQAQQLAAAYAHCSLKCASAEAMEGYEARHAELVALHHAARQLATAPTELRAEAERAVDELNQARAGWWKRRDTSIAELAAWLDQAAAELEAGAAQAAQSILGHVRAMYLPNDPYRQGIDPLLVRLARIERGLLRQGEAAAAELRALHGQLHSPSAPLREDELARLAARQASYPDPATQALWDELRRRAEQLLADARRIQLHAPDPTADRFAQLADTLGTYEHNATQMALQIEQRLADLANAIQHGQEVTNQQLTLLRAEDDRTTETLQHHRKLFVRAIAGLSLLMLMFMIVSIVVTR